MYILKIIKILQEKEKIDCPNIYRFDFIKASSNSNYVINEVEVISGAGMNNWMTSN